MQLRWVMSNFDQPARPSPLKIQTWAKSLLPTYTRKGTAMRDTLNSLWTDRGRLLQGAVAGAALIVALGFNWFGGYGFNWTTSGSAQKLVESAKSDAMIPICVDQFLALGPEVQVEYKAAKVSDHEDVVRKHIKKVGLVTVDYSFARACASMIDAR